MNLHREYATRPARWEDLRAVGDLARSADMVDWGEANTSEEEIAEDWSIPGLDLALDTWLIWSGSELCAYAWLLARKDHCELHGWGVVHPSHRGRGLGSFLLDLLEARAAQHAALAPPGEDVLHRNNVAASDPAARQLLRRRGFSLDRHFWRMDVELFAQPPQDPVPPDGIEVRLFTTDKDERPLHAAFEEAFADHYGHVPWSFDEWLATRIHGEGFDPTLWFVALEGQEIVGGLAGRIIEDVGWVNTLGVRRGWRRRGIGEHLLRRAFREFHRRGIERSSLYVDSQNETGATGLYERVGMSVAFQYDFYLKRLRGEADRAERAMGSGVDSPSP
jgi:mycothiol synthase